MAYPEFDDVLSGAIPDDIALRTVRSIVTNEIPPSDADRFLTKTIRLKQEDIDWLFNSPLEPSRTARVLSTALASLGDRSIIEAANNPSVGPKMLQILVRDITSSAPQIARILVLRKMLTLRSG
ncbi:hypothetical protein H009_06127 [Agrobacterium tumefaciens str. Cherry 2E-2-2]|nr:hypothetical protein H009_06127 [Agrobacterium tumefaciens str. Cherry 2E-2-2]